MINKYPNLLHFNRLYWHQTAPDLYGAVEDAFRKYLELARKLPDKGHLLRRILYKELMLIVSNGDYEKWAADNKFNEEAIKAVGGNIISREAMERLTQILETECLHQDA